MRVKHINRTTLIGGKLEKQGYAEQAFQDDQKTRIRDDCQKAKNKGRKLTHRRCCFTTLNDQLV